MDQDNSVTRDYTEAWKLESGDEQPAAALDDDGSRHTGSPLSQAQLAIWLHEQLHPDSAIYNLSHILEMEDIDPGHWKTAVHRVALEQPAQRTNIIEGSNGQPLQVVGATPNSANFVLVDAKHLDDAEIDSLVAEAANRRFDLETDPLYRMTLLATANGRHIMIAQAHHIISDLWSLGAWLNALARHHQVECGLMDSKRQRPLRVTPASNAAAEAEWLSSPEAAAELNHWLEQTVELPHTELPTAAAGALSPPFKTADSPLSSFLDIAATKSLTTLVHDNGVDLADAALAALGVALSRYGSTNDVVVGTLRARRNAPNARTMGMFANEVMLRFAIDPRATFAETARNVRSVNSQAADHDRLPLSTIVRAIRERTSGHGLADRPAFDVSFGWQATGRNTGKSVISALALGIGGVESEVSGIRFRTRQPPALIAHAPLTVVGAVFDERLHLTATYQNHLVSKSTAQRVLDHVIVILQAAASDFATVSSQVDIIGPAEAEQRRKFLVGPIEASNGGTILDRFDAAVANGPNRPATTDGDISFTYADAAREVDRIAQLLLERNVHHGEYVAVQCEPSARLPLALLAIMRCGAAYLPIDPRYPSQRQDYMLADSGARVVIVDDQTTALPASIAQVPLLAEPSSASFASHAEERSIEPGDEAYLMYTSGSTGSPKGVRQTHRTMNNLVRSLSDRPGFGPEDCMLAIASHSFDISIVELLMPLAVGGEVFVADADLALDPTELAALVASSGATVFQATPATWRILIDADWRQPSLTVWSQAEELTREVANELLDRVEHVWNLYGPTETHDCTVARVDHSVGAVSIGTPIANTQLEVVDDDLRAMPLGCRGELLVAGAGVAKGYLGRPDLTDERFIHWRGEQWYRTGDFVTLFDDGVLRYDGRADHQVKLRGHRIELGEIEAALTEHIDVAESVVIMHTVAVDDHRLVAYIVPSTGASLDDEKLLDYLGQLLPSVMIPSAFELLESIPRLPNQKIDRSQLAAPLRWVRRGGDLVAPRTATERALTRIWCEVLGLIEVSIHDNFFDLGGHSLLATQIASRVRSRMGVYVNLRAIYDNPTVASMALQIDDTPSRAVEQTLPDVDHSVPLPLSYSQERMWFLHQLLPEGAGYNMAGALRIHGPLDLSALEVAFSQAVVRHEALRTRFVTIEGVPRQVIEDAWPVTIDLIDHTTDGSPSEPVETSLAAELQRDADRPFKLDELPLIRLRAHRLGRDEHVLFVNMHHIIGDEWTFGILAEEISAAYLANISNSHVALDDRVVQHTNYAVWHRDWLDSGVMAEQLEYWRTHLCGVVPVELPTDHPRPRMLSGNGRNIEVDMSTELFDAVKGLASAMRTSPFVVLLAAFKVLLHRHTGLTDLTVGSPIANRNTLESERVITSLVNGLVMRTDIDGCVSFSDVVERVHNTTLDAFTNQDMPFEKLVEELKPRRDPSRSPLFQIFFNVLTAPFEPVSLAGTTIVEEHIERGAAQFDLTMTIGLNRRKIAVDYSTDLFDHERIERLLHQYIGLLDVVLKDPDRGFGAIDLRSSDEQIAISTTWGHNSAEPFDDHAVLHDLVSAQAAANPGSPAAAGANLSLTYAELDLQANQLANKLISSGVERGDAVGILLERSAWSVVAMIGINRAGAAFVPLDPDFPAERVQFMLEDSGATGLVTSKRLSDDLTIPADVVVCCPEEGDHLAAGLTAPNIEMTSADLAWIMYTSGSTGQPKGIEIEHRSAVNLFTSMAKVPGIGPDDIVMSVTSASFDPSIQDVYLPLLNGAMVYVAPQSAVVDAHVLRNLLETTGATHMFSTPTTWQMLVEVGWTGSSTFSAQTGGEAMGRSLVDELIDRAGSVWNLYGLTETTIWSSACRLEHGDGPISVGPPIANTSFHILDANEQPCPAGVPGELYIGGVGVGRRFRHRPDLDTSRIIDNPDGADRHSRLFRTGDIATYDLNGRLIFQGRDDDQVKIRGRRVEIAEIEVALATHPEVERSVVTAFQLRNDGTRLAAYLVTKAGHDPSDSSLREHLRRYLPDYMLPVSYTRLDKFPLTPNRKVDRRALPEPKVSGIVDIIGYVDPADDLELQIAEVWKRHLSLEQVGRHDDFFELGGHSLLAIRVFADLEKQTGRFYPVAALFRGPTVAELATVIRTDWQTPFTSLVQVQPHGTKKPFFSVSPFLITTLSYQMLARHLGSDQPVYAFQPQGMETDDPIHENVEDMARHYIREMKVIQPEGPYRVGGHCAGNWVAFEMASQLQAAGEEIELLVLVDSEPPLVVESPHTFRAYTVVAQAFAQLRHYYRDDRLRLAAKWQFGLARQRFLLRWTAGEEQRRLANIRAAHRKANASYRPTGTFTGDALFIRSQESIDLRHNDWHMRWAELITGDLSVVVVPGSHATLLLEDDNTEVMASHIADAMNLAKEG